MRIGLVMLITALLVAPAAGAAATVGPPTLRVAPGPSLVIVGTGFRPRALVRLHLAGPGIERQVVVRAGARGGFTRRFLTERCSIDQVSATTAAGARARVPVAWFVRECPPPPPLAPGAAPA